MGRASLFISTKHEILDSSLQDTEEVTSLKKKLSKLKRSPCGLETGLGSEMQLGLEMQPGENNESYSTRQRSEVWCWMRTQTHVRSTRVAKGHLATKCCSFNQNGLV